MYINPSNAGIRELHATAIATIGEKKITVFITILFIHLFTNCLAVKDGKYARDVSKPTISTITRTYPQQLDLK